MATAISTLEDAEKTFRDAGMFALVLQERLLFLARMSNKTESGSISIDGTEVSVIQYPCDGLNGDEIFLEDPGFVECIGGEWRFRNVPPAIFGGVNPYAVRHPADSPDSAIDVAWTYYFGQPVVLDGWIIPIHRHPAWDINAIRAAWAQPTVMTTDEWAKRLKADLAALQHHNCESDPEPNANPFAFCQLQSTRSHRFAMQLRMDCREVCKIDAQ
jgi:hypothetical protein